MINSAKTIPSFFLRLKQLTVCLSAGAFGTVLLFVLFGVLHTDAASLPGTILATGSDVFSFPNTSSHASVQPKRLAQVDFDNRINVDPAQPDSSDVITITASGIWPNTCRPVYVSHQVTENLIRIDAKAEPSGMVCGEALTPWAFSVPVGPLVAGVYRIDLYITRLNGLPTIQETTFFTVTPAPVSGLITDQGGEITQRYPGHSTALTIPPGALTTPATFTISYQTPPTITGELQGMDHFFNILGTQTAFAVPLTLTVRYSDSLRAPIIAGTENLYRLQSGQWVTDAITSTARLSDGLSAQINRLSQFGILGKTHRIYLPIIFR